MRERHRRNREALSKGESEMLATKTAAIVGCGGLGGYLIEYLARIGVGTIMAADGDRFEESNLNRQLLSTSANSGESKAEAAARRVNLIDPELLAIALPVRVDAANGPDLFRGADILLDAVDGIESRFVLQQTAETLGIPLIHGAVAGWYGQVSTIFPGDRTLDMIYGKSGSGRPAERGIEERLGNLSFGPAFIAAIQAAEAVKVLTGKGRTLRGSLLVADLLEHDYEVLELKRSEAPGKGGMNNR